MDLIKNKTLQLYTIKKIFLAAVIYSLATIPGKLLLTLASWSRSPLCSLSASSIWYAVGITWCHRHYFR